MRVWDISPQNLCRNHLLGEHREIHAMWSVITQNKIGYSQHPETKRWKGKLKALYLRHEKIAFEMQKRGYVHKSSLDKRKATGKKEQDIMINSIEEQMQILKKKKCDCRI